MVWKTWWTTRWRSDVKSMVNNFVKKNMKSMTKYETVLPTQTSGFTAKNDAQGTISVTSSIKCPRLPPHAADPIYIYIYIYIYIKKYRNWLCFYICGEAWVRLSCTRKTDDNLQISVLSHLTYPDTGNIGNIPNIGNICTIYVIYVIYTLLIWYYAKKLFNNEIDYLFFYIYLFNYSIII